MYQARVTQVVPGADRTEVVVTLVAPGLKGSSRYVLEIVTEHGDLLSVPNEAIIETGDKRVVYVQGSAGDYAQREVELGVQGELFTEVVKGLMPGEQVVTFGSFFIDADHKLKVVGPDDQADDHRHHPFRHPFPLDRVVPGRRAWWRSASTRFAPSRSTRSLISPTPRSSSTRNGRAARC